jgi:UTP--glucose-1-phosphate uridylyltransferase
MIVNHKTVDPRDEKSPPVYQIETAMGSAISLFEGAVAVNVPRARFLPVKTCNDLLAVRSDCFVYSEREGLRINPVRESTGRNETIRIRLDAKYYGNFDQMEARFRRENRRRRVRRAHPGSNSEVTIRGAVTITNPARRRVDGKRSSTAT